MLSITSSRPDLAGMGTTLVLLEQTSANFTSTPAVNRPEPMDLSYAEDEGEVELQAADQQRVVRRRYVRKH